MSKLVSAVKRKLSTPDAEASVHFHQSSHEALPEVCYHDACPRPRLQIS